jgi:RNA polymerase sigma-70 factor (ECF subfamily)
VHCYRMLGSFSDAEDALQDTLLDAWQGLAGFEGRASARSCGWSRFRMLSWTAGPA